MCSRLKYVLLQSRTEQLPCKSSEVEEKIPMYLWAMNYFSRKDENSAETKNVGNVNSALRFLRFFQVFFEIFKEFLGPIENSSHV